MVVTILKLAMVCLEPFTLAFEIVEVKSGDQTGTGKRAQGQTGKRARERTGKRAQGHTWKLVLGRTLGLV